MKIKKFIFILFIAPALFTCKQPNQNTRQVYQDSACQDDNRLFVENDTWMSANVDTIGNPFISNYKLPRQYDTYKWSIVQDVNNFMLFANRKGIISFDGSSWDLALPSTVPFITLEKAHKGTVLAGFDGGFGCITRNNKGSYQLINWSDSISGVGEISKIDENKEFYFFYSENKVYLKQKNNAEIKIISTPGPDFFQGYIKYKQQFYLYTANKKLYQITENELKNIKDTVLIPDTKIIFSIAHSDKYNLVATKSSRIYLFDGKEFTPYQCEAGQFLKENFIVNGISLSKQEFAVGTVSGGVVIINKKTGKTLSTINYQTGLPDDEIFALGIDRNKGLWISHEFGVSRVNFAFPVKNYHTFPGIQGIIISVVHIDNSLYLATTEGLFWLDKVKNYREIEIFYEKAIERKHQKKQEKQEQGFFKRVFTRDEDKKEKDGLIDRWRKKRQERKEKQNKKGFFKRIFGGKDEKAAEKAEKDTTTNDTSHTSLPADMPEAEPEREESRKKFNGLPESEKVKIIRDTVQSKVLLSKKSYAVQSIRYLYKKIDGLNAKCRQVYPFQSRLLTATNQGLYEIKDKVAFPVIENVYIHRIEPLNDKSKLVVCTDQGFIILSLHNDKYELDKTWFGQNFNEVIFSAAHDSAGTLWLGGENVAYKITDITKNQVSGVYFFNNNFVNQVFVRNISNRINFILENEMYFYHPQQDTMLLDTGTISNQWANPEFIYTQDSLTWAQVGQHWQILSPQNKNQIPEMVFLNLFNDIKSIFVDNNKDIWISLDENKIYRIVHTDSISSDIAFNVFIKKVQNGSKKQSFYIDKLNLDYENNSLHIEIAAPFYAKNKSTQYQYFVEGLMDDWSNWSTNQIIELPYIPPGDYIFHIRAKNILGEISEKKSFSFQIQAPFYLQTWFFVLAALFLATLVFLIIKLRELKLKRDKEQLERIVEERTAKINKQKEEITSSIRYASYLQTAILPPVEQLKKWVNEYFIFNRPRDIVSGDYYFFTKVNNKLIVVTADCTGHGVPGAFLSMLGTSLLTQIIEKNHILEPDKILNLLRKGVIEALHQEGKEKEAKDGMDIALYTIDLDKLFLEFAGGYNHLLIIRNGELHELKADRMPIGFHPFKKNNPFTKKDFQLQSGDILITCSDGYVDQFGGEKGRKFRTKNFKDLLLSISHFPLPKQKEILIQRIDQWSQGYRQIDDMLIVGIKI